MITKDIIIKKANKKGVIKTSDFLNAYDVSRQYVSNLISQLVEQKQLIKFGATRGARYITPEYLNEHIDEFPTHYRKQLKNANLEEHKVLEEIERYFVPYNNFPENIKSIFTYAFSEMLNNAIEHSESKKINVSVDMEKHTLIFVVRDFGIGVFQNVMQKRDLQSEFEAMQDILKGKTTTMPKLHSGEGIFFTSKIADKFMLDSYGYQLIVDNTIDDVFMRNVSGKKRGTNVMFQIDTMTNRHLNDVFNEYTNQSAGSDYGFDKTKIRIKLYTQRGVHISRSQARRVLASLEKFDIIVMDYDKVPMVGQAFADEVYRVFKNKYSHIMIENEHMNESVKFMVERAMTESKK